MPDGVLELWVGVEPRRPVTDDGETLVVPEGWALLPPGDAALTRRVKAAGAAWVIRKKKGRRIMSQGVWAPAETIERLGAERAAELEDPTHQRRLEQGRARRAKAQASYVEDFTSAVAAFLDFAPVHATLQAELAQAIARHATPVGSGTVARTERIPIERRAEAATIAWLRHNSTDYDDMKIPRVKGMRREVRRALAERSRRLLANYRDGTPTLGACPLRAALDRSYGPVEDLL